MPEHPPVTDWVDDFDQHRSGLDGKSVSDLGETACGLRRRSTERFLGCYMPTTYQAVKEIAYDTDHFLPGASSCATFGRRSGAGAPPITSDPPEHKPAKQLLLPPFTPDAMKKLEPRVRGICNELIDEFIADGECDAAARAPSSSGPRHRAHARNSREGRRSLHQVDSRHPRTRHQGRQRVDGGGEGDDRLFRRPHRASQDESTDDLISTLMNATDKDGQPLADEHVLGSLRLLLIAGIDTTWRARSVPRCGISPRRPRIASGWLPSRN